jgi:Gluconate 2-dehydrogenase subunit 3
VPDVEAQAVTISRRAVVKALGAAAVWPYLSDSAAQAFAAIQATQAPPRLAFLTAGQYTILDAPGECSSAGMIVSVSALMKRASPQLTPSQATDLLTPLSRNEAEPKTPLEQFFKTTKDATIRGYYTSEIGIHKELEYKGNRVLAEFVGCTHPEHGYEPGK